jgi:hypothetical protein
METWAEERHNSRIVENSPPNSIAGEEWPLFGCAFYTWASQEMLRAHLENPEKNPVDPRNYAISALDATAVLALDPAEGNWVREMWGEERMFDENAFYRMAVLACLAGHAEVTGDTANHDFMHAYADDLATDIDQSQTGLLRDYPPECYPGDVLAAIVAISDADTVLGMERGAFYTRARRGFSGDALHPLGIPPFEAWLHDTVTPGSFRGSGNAYLTIFGPKVWPKQSAAWYRAFDEHLWQERYGLAGFREYLREESVNEWDYSDVDAGPVLAGFGVSATAYGVGAARVNGRLDQAFPLAAQMIAGSWPLPDGTLLLPRLLSQGIHAPHLGEAAIVFNLVQRPVYDEIAPATGGLPPLVYAVCAMYIGTALILCFAVLRDIRRGHKVNHSAKHPRLQLALWGMLWTTGLTLWFMGSLAGLILLALGILLPRFAGADTKASVTPRAKEDVGDKITPIPPIIPTPPVSLSATAKAPIEIRADVENRGKA